MKKANLNGVNCKITSRPVLGRAISLLAVLWFIVVFIPACLWYGAKEAAPDLLHAIKKALGVAFLPWGEND